MFDDPDPLVLVVADSDEVRRSFARHLARTDVDWHVMPSREAEGRLLERLHPTVLVIEVSMTDRDVVEIIRNVRRLNPAPALLLLQNSEVDTAEVTGDYAGLLGIEALSMLPIGSVFNQQAGAVGAIVGLLARWKTHQLRRHLRAA